MKNSVDSQRRPQINGFQGDSQQYPQNNGFQGYEYGLVFCSPFKQSKIHRFFSCFHKTDSFPMERNTAEEHFYRIFKTTKEDIKNNPALSGRVKTNLDKLLRHTNAGGFLEFHQFTWTVLQCIFLVLQEEPRLEDLKHCTSINKNEKIFNIKASETFLQKEAARVSYRLQFKHFDDEKKPYQVVPPYVAYDEQILFENNLKRYNRSLFNDLDRIRLIASSIDSRLERSELYSLGILLSEVYMSTNHSQDEIALINNAKSSNNEQLRMSFGERTALLYAWLGFYYLWWLVPGFIGLGMFSVRFTFEYISEGHFSIAWNGGAGVSASVTYMAFAVFLSIYSSLLIALWKRKENTLAWEWGTTELSESRIQRHQFQGVWKRDGVTGQMRKHRETELRSACKRATSFLLILVLIVIDIAVVALIFAYRTTLDRKSGWIQFGGALLNAVQAKVMGLLYRYVAKLMNNLENIEFETPYYNALCTKLFLFQFVNAYASLFYIAFVKNSTEGCLDDNCLYELNIQFLTIFATFWVFNIVKMIISFLAPKIRLWWKLKLVNKTMKLKKEPFKRAEDMTETESQFTLKHQQESPLEDHMDFVILYGYILMFSVCFPLACFLFAIPGLFDVVTKLAKQFFLLNQPFPHYAKGVGVWNKIVLFINVIAAFTNPAIVIFTAGAFPDSTVNHVWIYYFAISSGLLLCKLLVNAIFPAVPDTVKLGLQWGNRIARERQFGRDVLDPKQTRTAPINPIELTDSVYASLLDGSSDTFSDPSSFIVSS